MSFNRVRSLIHAVLIGSGPLASTVLAASPPDYRFVEATSANQTAQLGQGWDSASETKKSAICVEADQANIAGQVTSIDTKVVWDNDSFSSQMGVSARARYDAGAYSGGGSASFEQNVSFSSKNTYVSVTADVANGPTFLVPKGADSVTITKRAFAKLDRPPISGSPDALLAQATVLRTQSKQIRLSADALALVQAKNFDEFDRICGDSFVSEADAGGRVVALLNIHDTSTSESQRIQTSMEGGGAGASFSASFTSAVNEAHDHHAVTLNMKQFGGQGSDFPYPSVDELLKAVSKLPGDAAKYPVPRRFVVTPYRSLPDWPGVEFGFGVDNLEQSARNALRASAVWNEIAEVLKAPYGYQLRTAKSLKGAMAEESVEDLQQLQDELAAFMKKVSDDLKNCKANGTCESSPPDTFAEYDYRLRLPVEHNAWTEIVKESQSPSSIPQVESEAKAALWLRPTLELRRIRFGEIYLNSEVNAAIAREAGKLQKYWSTFPSTPWPPVFPKPPDLLPPKIK